MSELMNHVLLWCHKIEVQTIYRRFTLLFHLLVGEVHPYLVLQVFKTKTPDEDFETPPRLTQRNPIMGVMQTRIPCFQCRFFSKGRLYF